MELVKLEPIVKDYIWGGTYFKSPTKGPNKTPVSECWELSRRGEDSSKIVSGPDCGKSLDEVIKDTDVGSISAKYPDNYLPLLIKLIDAQQNLSVQVHPCDKYAEEHENSFGKCEMWHIIDADEGSGLYVGLNRDYTRDEIEEALNNGTILNCLNFYKVKPGDTFTIKPGTIHAIGKGVRLIEVQQNSDVTYRLYDYNRVDKNGNPRELHIKKALDVIDYHKYDEKKQVEINSCIAGTDYFSVYRIDIDDEQIIEATKESFKSFTFLEGSGFVDDVEFNKYDTFFLPAGKKCLIKGKSTIIVSVAK